ncbi:hypothetical protein DICPUDRAFT_82812 [Dictyostelium purpureum]|uniref:CP-type G domain-containing protein n=1 Tax=Dictyostelium purpureum TaxID=5786 RepID=F0ZXP1_DICPU|nr:uncharacterized protein DICPUDRAFT_82812 [Dictyostelium purpureum]EGC31276.1 hypothetical protein DICPUDRAFT_82812 [Dictyostelium purpureum]|eukprot:XP_003292185.1 hypothetical protein DICPUDRAFT_82812 [Dictyostelium purpureum]
MGKHRASKRQSLHHKHKVEKKVAEHRRKVRKFAKEHPELNKAKKDPGIPNLWPFKEDLLTKIENHKQQLSEEKKKKKEQRRLEQMASARKDVASMVQDAKRRESEFERKQEELEERMSKGTFEKERSDNSLRSFYREVKKVIEAADVIIQVLDARDPMGCRCLDIEKMILERYTNKKIVLVLNKIDLVPRENVQMWLKYLRNFYPTLAFKCSTQNQRRNLGQSSINAETATQDALNSTESLGAEQLLQLLKNYSRSLNIKTSVSVGIIGYPNVGKSSLINSLKRTRSVGVGATPGFTKIAQEVHLDKNVKLLDSPGIVPVKGNVDENIILRNVVKLEKVADPIAPVEAILQRCSQKQILEIYEIAEFSSTVEFLSQVANKRKKVGKGGIADLHATALSVIRDWTGGKIPFYTQPPKIQVKSTIVNQFSDELNIDQTDLLSTISNAGTSFASLKSSEPVVGDLDESLFDEEDEDDEEEMEEDDDEEEMEDEEEEEEDEEEMDEDEDDDMDLLRYQQQKQIVQSKVTKQVSNNKAKVQNLKDENDQYNPQQNKSLKKQNKKLKKKFGIVSLNNTKQDYSDDDEQVDDNEDDEDIDEGEVF